MHCIIGSDRSLFFQAAPPILKPGGILMSKTMFNEVPETITWCNFDPQTHYTIHNSIATRDIGDSNRHLQK
ncbi:hypothetical protein [Okeania sp.]|uniref:hypothetical protein n=1 Tax=Okeania sp. TaxID=3100323 RepID=UPI002B4AEFBC|nr:hypothetical protein [Okeania sp.]MEB3339534.1 hypothetical protein [Okeania sp.]